MPASNESPSPDASARAARRGAGGTPRALVVAVLVVLIVVAAAGIVLAGRQASRAPTGSAAATASSPAVSSTTPDAAAAPTAAASAPPITEVRFAAGSAVLPAEASGGLAQLGDALRASGEKLMLTARYPAGVERSGAEIARRRVEAVQHALQSNGVSGSRIQSETIEVPAGTLAPGHADRIELTVR